MAHRNQHSDERNALIADQGFDRDEKVLLHVARLYFLAYTDPCEPHWEQAIDHCVGSFGPGRGPRIAYGVTDVLRAMREARKGVFRFTNPCCAKCAARLTDGERLLINTIASMRRGDKARARVNALMLCEGHDTSILLDAAQRLSASMEALRA
ncbi:MAG: hypothetical protein AAF724_23215 [Pseudomonadota bacterium]